MEKVLEYLKPDYVKGLSSLAGSLWNILISRGFSPLLRKIREVYPQKDIWCLQAMILTRMLKAG